MGEAEKLSGDEPGEANARPRRGTGEQAPPAEPAGPGTPREISRDIRETGTSRGTREHRDIPGAARDIRGLRDIPESIPDTPGHRDIPEGIPTLGHTVEQHRSLWRSFTDTPRGHSGEASRDTPTTIPQLKFFFVLF